MIFDDNPYYDPGKWEWEGIDEVDYGGSWEFDIYAFFKDDEGNVRFGTDAGCSCPAPFEYFRPMDFEVLTKKRWQQIKLEMHGRAGDGYTTHGDVRRVIRKVEEVFRAR